MTAIVQAVSLSKQVLSGEQPLTILFDASFTVAAGESLAIVGASGSGKSTLLGLLAGLDVPSSGTVKLNGTDLFALDEDGRARLRGELAGFVFQSFQLLPALSALETAPQSAVANIRTRQSFGHAPGPIRPEACSNSKLSARMYKNMPTASTTT